VGLPLLARGLAACTRVRSGSPFLARPLPTEGSPLGGRPACTAGEDCTEVRRGAMYLAGPLATEERTGGGGLASAGNGVFLLSGLWRGPARGLGGGLLGVLQSSTSRMSCEEMAQSWVEKNGNESSICCTAWRRMGFTLEDCCGVGFGLAAGVLLKRGTGGLDLNGGGCGRDVTIGRGLTKAGLRGGAAEHSCNSRSS